MAQTVIDLMCMKQHLTTHQILARLVLIIWEYFLVRKTISRPTTPLTNYSLTDGRHVYIRRPIALYFIRLLTALEIRRLPIGLKVVSFA